MSWAIIKERRRVKTDARGTPAVGVKGIDSLENTLSLHVLSDRKDPRRRISCKGKFRESSLWSRPESHILSNALSKSRNTARVQ